MGQSFPRRAFTLVEMLVVIAIIGVLMALIIPAVMKVRDMADRTSCANNLKQLGLAVYAYHDSHGHFPVNSLDATEVNSGTFGSQSRAWSWLARLLPFVEQGDLYRQGNIPKNTLFESQEVVAEQIKLFLCPSDSSDRGPRLDAADVGFSLVPGQVPGPYIPVGQTNYKGVSGANWMWGDQKWHNPGSMGNSDGLHHGDGIFFRSDYKYRRKMGVIYDGLSNTFMIGEDIPFKNCWCSWPYANNANGTCAIAPNATKPDGNDYDPKDWHNVYSFRSWHHGGLQFAYADGSVHFIRDTIDLATYRAMATIAGRESLKAD